jgi:TonB family protein
MNQRMVTAAFTLFVVLVGATQGWAQATETAQSASTAPLPAPGHRILTKDPEYLKLLSPPLGNDFLQAYSKGYRDKSAEIEASVAGIGDENLRSQARSQEWAKVLQKDQEQFRIEAETTFNDAKVSFLQKHRDDLFEVGRVAYDENNKSLVVITTPAAPIEAHFRLDMNGTTLNQIYDKFRQIAGQEIERKTREYVAKAGAGSICSRNPDWCYTFAKEDIEENLRSERVVVVAQGDVAGRKIDRLLLMDYDTESVFQELTAPPSALIAAAWRFSVGLLPSVSAEARPSDSQVQPAPVAATPDPPTPSANLPARIRVPGQVTAASIITRTPPRYPLQARAHQLQGDVVLHAIIDKEGKISEVQVLAGDDLLAQSAVDAVRQWRYKPMLFDGEPAEVDTTITVSFSLD